MKNLSFLFCLALMISSCSKDNDSPTTGSFEYTISGAASEVISGTETNFGLNNGELFISLIDDTDDLVIRILIDPVVSGTYLVNPVLLENNQVQDILVGDAFADLGIGSTLTGDRRNFSTNAGNGGSVTLTNVEANVLEGNFNINMRELLGGGTNQPEVNIQGSFTALKQ